MKKTPLALIMAVFVTSPILRAHEAAGEMAEAASVWLATLSEEQQELAQFSLTDSERENWHFVPKPFEGEEMRGGLTLKDMRPDQQHLAYALLQTGLSHRGFLSATQIMSLEQVLWELENDPKRDTSMYYVSIFGEPGAEAWGWRFEGHHLSLNFTISGGKVVSGTPNFFASNPGEVVEGPRKGLRVLAAEEDVAREMVLSLSDEQRAIAVFVASWCRSFSPVVRIVLSRDQYRFSKKSRSPCAKEIESVCVAATEPGNRPFSDFSRGSTGPPRDRSAWRVRCGVSLDSTP